MSEIQFDVVVVVVDIVVQRMSPYGQLVDDLVQSFPFPLLADPVGDFVVVGDQRMVVVGAFEFRIAPQKSRRMTS